MGNATDSMIQRTPIPIGNAVRSSCISWEGDGKKQLTTLWSNIAIAEKTNIGIIARIFDMICE